jgi:energy-coupling factor transporter transmembrane protein EcfT
MEEMPPIPPRPRLAATILAAVGSLIANRLPLLAIALIVVIVLMARAHLIGVLLKFLLSVILPTAGMLILAWGLIIRAAPGEAMGTDPRGAIEYASMISLRLALLGVVIQLAMLSVPPRLLPVTLRAWGIKGELMVLSLGVFAIGPELILRAEQISTARKSRGLASRGPIGQLREITRMLRPLFVWSIRSAVHRADGWHQRALLLKVDHLPHAETEFWPAGGMIALLLSAAWLVLSIYTHVA